MACTAYNAAADQAALAVAIDRPLLMIAARQESPRPVKPPFTGAAGITAQTAATPR